MHPVLASSLKTRACHDWIYPHSYFYNDRSLSSQSSTRYILGKKETSHVNFLKILYTFQALKFHFLVFFFAFVFFFFHDKSTINPFL